MIGQRLAYLIETLGWVIGCQPRSLPRKRKVNWANPEDLESRALLSASGNAIADQAAVTDHVPAGAKRFLAPINTGGPWYYESTGQFSGAGTAQMYQYGYNARKITIYFHVNGLNPIKFVDRLTKENPYSLEGQTVRVALPGIPDPVKLNVTVSFEHSQVVSLEFTAQLTLPDGTLIAAMTGTHTPPVSAGAVNADSAEDRHAPPTLNSQQPKGSKSVFLLLDVAGTWEVDIDGEFYPGKATVVLNQANQGKLVTVGMTVPTGQMIFSFTDKFTAKSPDTLSGKTQKMILFGHPKLREVSFTLTFPVDTIHPQTFTGTYTIPGAGTMNLSGTLLSKP